jgi:hypothetical protein
MHIERVSFADSPQDITTQSADCLWVLLSERQAPRPRGSPALQWVDWRLQGLISRFLMREKPGDPLTTFVPTMKKLAYPFVAIDGASRTDWKSFHRNCEGMHLKRILFFCEEDSRIGALEKEFRKQSSAEFPQHVMFGYEQSVEKG